MQMMVKDVAELFGVSEKTIYRWISSEGLPAFRLNKRYRFNRTDLMQWASSRKMGVSADTTSPAEESPNEFPGLLEALQAGGVFYRVEGKDKSSVLREVVELLRLPAAADREYLLQILLEREAMASTAVGDGIAIPHVRNPIVLHIPSPMATLCYLENPVDFGALDGKPVNILFALVSPTIQGHLRVLSHLAYALRDPHFKEVILNEATREQLFVETRRVESLLAQPEQTQVQEACI